MESNQILYDRLPEDDAFNCWPMNFFKEWLIDLNYPIFIFGKTIFMNTGSGIMPKGELTMDMNPKAAFDKQQNPYLTYPDEGMESEIHPKFINEGDN